MYITRGHSRYLIGYLSYTLAKLSAFALACLLAWTEIKLVKCPCCTTMNWAPPTPFINSLLPHSITSCSMDRCIHQLGCQATQFAFLTWPLYLLPCLLSVPSLFACTWCFLFFLWEIWWYMPLLSTITAFQRWHILSMVSWLLSLNAF